MLLSAMRRRIPKQRQPKRSRSDYTGKDPNPPIPPWGFPSSLQTGYSLAPTAMGPSPSSSPDPCWQRTPARQQRSRQQWRQLLNNSQKAQDARGPTRKRKSKPDAQKIRERPTQQSGIVVLLLMWVSTRSVCFTTDTRRK